MERIGGFGIAEGHAMLFEGAEQFEERGVFQQAAGGGADEAGDAGIEISAFDGL